MKSAGGQPLWITIPGWEEFQHRDSARSKVPPWIKVFTRLLSDDAYLSLTSEQRGVLHGIWLEYARSLRQLPANTTTLSRRLGITVRASQLEALHARGFLTFSTARPDVLVSASEPPRNHLGTMSASGEPLVTTAVTTPAAQDDTPDDAGSQPTYASNSASKSASNSASDPASPDGDGDGEKRSTSRAVPVARPATAAGRDDEPDLATAAPPQRTAPDFPHIRTTVARSLADASRSTP